MVGVSGWFVGITADLKLAELVNGAKDRLNQNHSSPSHSNKNLVKTNQEDDIKKRESFFLRGD